MSKKFNIHDWQAKQRQQLLKENFANQKYYDLLNDLRDEGHLHRYGVTQLQMQFGLKEKEAQEIYNQYKEDLKAEQPDAYDFYMKDLNEEINPNQDPKTILSKQIVNIFNGRLGNWYKENVTSMRDVDNLFKRDREILEKLVYDQLRDHDELGDGGNLGEMNTTGGGASFDAGSGEGYMTPNAFKKKKKK